jgi:hypothetical protein
MPTIILLRHPIRELFPVRILAIQPASAPKIIQESQLKFETTGSMLRFLLIKLKEYQALLSRVPAFKLPGRAFFLLTTLFIIIHTNTMD